MLSLPRRVYIGFNVIPDEHPNCLFLGSLPDVTNPELFRMPSSSGQGALIPNAMLLYLVSVNPTSTSRAIRPHVMWGRVIHFEGFAIEQDPSVSV